MSSQPDEEQVRRLLIAGIREGVSATGSADSQAARQHGAVFDAIWRNASEATRKRFLDLTEEAERDLDRIEASEQASRTRSRGSRP